ncbi:hypothetical protein [Clostridium sp.]|jgi:hypothetical protein|uniref:hypothetical protein n=1 Tax=Clostridium sp. TaxID=1506 RepID=UPI0039F4CCB2
MDGCSIISVGKNGFTEILQLEQVDWQLIELYKKICVNKDGMIFITDGKLIDFEVKSDNMIIWNIYDIEEAYERCIGDVDEEYYMELIEYIKENYDSKDFINSEEIIEF